MRPAVRPLAIIMLTLAVAGVAVGCRAMTGGRTAGEATDDARITAAVKSKLVADRAANLTQVDVDTRNGTVYLTGTVANAEQRARAEDLARETRGVVAVVNNLRVQPPR